MAHSDDLYASKTTYVLDAENAAEMARLINQSQLVTKAMGGVFPESIDLAPIHDVLDIACGPGGWVIDVATQYPTMKVQGIDISEMMIHYASIVAEEQDVSNAHFRVMNALEPLDFPDNSFDFVNARLLGGFMTSAKWPEFVQECWRITRSGGYVRLTECDFSLKSDALSETLQTLTDMTKRAMQLAGQYFLQDGQDGQDDTGSTLYQLLYDTGFRSLQRRDFDIDVSAGIEAYADMYQNFRVFLKLIQPFLIKMGVTTQEEVDVLYHRAMTEMRQPQFQAVWPYHSALGQKLS